MHPLEHDNAQVLAAEGFSSIAGTVSKVKQDRTAAQHLHEGKLDTCTLYQPAISGKGVVVPVMLKAKECSPASSTLPLMIG